MTNKRKQILITNDDGIHAKGLKELISVAAEFGDVLVVAPHMPRSGMSMAITVDMPIRLKKYEERDNLVVYSCKPLFLFRYQWYTLFISISGAL